MSTKAKRSGQKHHYVPCFYLKQWTGADGRLCEFSKPYKQVIDRRKFPDATAYERGLYTFSDLSDADFLEQRFLLRSDNLAYAALRLLLQGNVEFERHMKSAWSRFLMTLFHRVPERIAQIRERINLNLGGEIEQFRPSYEARRESDSPTFEQFVASLSSADVQSINLSALRRLMDSELMGNKLNSMIWITINFDDSHHPLLTGDRPMMMTNGLNYPHSHLVLPISPRRLFGAVNDMREGRRLIQMAESWGLAQRVNNAIARQARKYVYAVDAKPLAFVASRLGDQAPWSPFGE